MAVLTCSVLWGVLTRYVTEKPAVWTTELSGILFTWVVFIGALSAFRHDQHIRVTFLTDSLPEAFGNMARKIADLIVIAFLVYAAYLSYDMMLKGATRPSPVLRIPFSLVYLAPLIAFALMAINAVLRFVGAVQAEPAANVEGGEL